MQLERPSETRLLVRDDPRRFSRWVGLALAAMVLLVALAGQSLWSGLVALLAAAAIWYPLRRAEVATEASFDRTEGRYRLRQLRGDREVSRREGRLEEIENVVVEAAARSGRTDRRLELRPALVVEGRPLPLSFATFAGGEEPRDIALALRDFLGLTGGDLIEDSLRLAARDPLRVNPAVRLARLGKGLSHREAATYVKRLKAELGERPKP